MIDLKNEKMINKLTVVLESSAFATWIAVDIATWNERLELALKILSLISFVLVIIINYEKVIDILRNRKQRNNESNSKD